MSLEHVNAGTPFFSYIFPTQKCWIFRCNHRFLALMERDDQGGRTYQDILGVNDGSIGWWHQILWNLAATHRTWTDPEITFEEFLDMLPAGRQFQLMQTNALRIIAEFAEVKESDEPQPINADEVAEGNDLEAPSEPTGPSSTEPSSES